MEHIASAAEIADRFNLTASDVRGHLLDAQAFGWVTRHDFFGETWSLTERGRLENERQLAAERDHSGAEAVVREAHRAFLPLNEPGATNSDNAVLTSHAYHNNLVNWPRGNNGFAESGGGWPGTLVWSGALRPLARGNIVHMNGGEGIISYGTEAGRQSGSALFEQNVAYDNWSVNMLSLIHI